MKIKTGTQISTMIEFQRSATKRIMEEYIIPGVKNAITKEAENIYRNVRVSLDEIRKRLAILERKEGARRKSCPKK